jgi:hypothetical protein
MKEYLSLSEEIKKNVVFEKKEYQKNISYSQFSAYESCPYRWYMTYAKGNYLFNSSINTIFGTAIHEAIQHYIKLIFEKSAKEADKYDIIGHFEAVFKEEYIKERANNNGIHFSTKQEMAEFYEDGVQILEQIRKKRKDIISNRHHELLGMEIPINTEIKDDSDVFIFNGYLDLVYRDKRDETVYIEDIKTSTKGWTKYQKSDETKLAQLLLYKKFFGKQYEISEKYIVPRYRILKRKLWENADFPQSRIQVHEPANGTGKINNALQRLNVFINDCFDSTGNPIDKNYVKKPSASNCKFCPFNDKPEYCDKIVDPL